MGPGSVLPRRNGYSICAESSARPSRTVTTAADSPTPTEELIEPGETPTGLAAISEELLSIPLAQFFPGKELDDDPTTGGDTTQSVSTKMLEAPTSRCCFKGYLADRAVYKCVVNNDPEVKYWRTVESRDGLSEGRSNSPSHELNVVQAPDSAGVMLHVARLDVPPQSIEVFCAR